MCSQNQNLILLAFVALFSCSLYPQNGKITYSFKTLYTLGGQKSQTAVLYFNETESLFVYNKIGMDSVQRGTSITTSTENHAVGGIAVNVSHIDEEGTQVYRNFKTKSIFYRETRVAPIDAYTVEDIWMEIQWTIQHETKIIAGRRAKKAIGKFRGRTYIVWFTKEIPLPYGPWKLFGLPGMILEAHTKNQKYSITVQNLCYPCSATFETLLKKPYEKELKNLKEHVYFQDHFVEYVEKRMNDPIFGETDIRFIVLAARSKKDIIKYRNDYTMERLYGWETYPGDTSIPNPYIPIVERNSESVFRGEYSKFDFEKYKSTLPLENVKKYHKSRK